MDIFMSCAKKKKNGSRREKAYFNIKFCHSYFGHIKIYFFLKPFFGHPRCTHNIIYLFFNLLNILKICHSYLGHMYPDYLRSSPLSPSFHFSTSSPGRRAPRAATLLAAAEQLPPPSATSARRRAASSPIHRPPPAAALCRTAGQFPVLLSPLLRFFLVRSRLFLLACCVPPAPMPYVATGKK
jgi:hypothetical protein